MVGSALCRESGHRPSQLGVALRPQGRSGPLEEAAQSKEPKVYTLRQPFRVESISEFLVPGAWIGDAADCGMLNMTEDSPWWRDLPRTRSGSARTEGRLAALVIARRKRATVWNALQGCETAPGMQWTVTVADKPAYAVSFSTQPSKLVISNYGFFSSRPSLLSCICLSPSRSTSFAKRRHNFESRCFSTPWGRIRPFFSTWRRRHSGAPKSRSHSCMCILRGNSARRARFATRSQNAETSKCWCHSAIVRRHHFSTAAVTSSTVRDPLPSLSAALKSRSFSATASSTLILPSLLASPSANSAVSASAPASVLSRTPS